MYHCLKLVGCGSALTHPQSFRCTFTRHTSGTRNSNKTIKHLPQGRGLLSTRCTSIIPHVLIGPSDPEQPTSPRATGTSFNGTTIHWTVSRIAYTPETYTVHFGTSSGSLTPFNQQRQSGDNFTATNLQFSIQLTGLTPATDYSYRMVATNTIGRTAMSVIGTLRTLDVRTFVTRYTNSPQMHCSLYSM